MNVFKIKIYQNTYKVLLIYEVMWWILHSRNVKTYSDHEHAREVQRLVLLYSDSRIFCDVCITEQINDLNESCSDHPSGDHLHYRSTSCTEVEKIQECLCIKLTL
jgi:hypothetical protein